MTDDDEDILDVDAFTKLMKAAQDSSNFESHKTPFLRGPHLSSRQKRRYAQHQRELASSAHGCQPLTAGFLITPSSKPDLSTSSLPSSQLSPISPQILEQSNPSLVQHTSSKAKLHQDRLDAIHELEKKIASKKTNLQRQDLARHRAVLSFLKVQIRKPDHTRKETARQVAECYGRGSYISGNLVIFYPKFHCELNFIERFWCAAKYYARENCEYNLKGLRETVPKALDSVTVPAIFHYYQHCMRIMDAYRSELESGTKQFTEAIYRGHRQVVDKSKW